MKLKRLTERIFYLPFEQERDRPNLCYIRGDRFSVAVDAGHSADHVKEFYTALEEAGLSLPALTVLTHWHWDHTFGMHAVHGLTIANAGTDSHLHVFRDKVRREGREAFLSLDESIRREYPGETPVIITFPDLVFTQELLSDPGNCPIRLFRAVSPHTDDSTLVHIPGEKVLLTGDACGGAFPGGERDPEPNRALMDTIASVDADLVLEGHWVPTSKQELLNDMKED